MLKGERPSPILFVAAASKETPACGHDYGAAAFFHLPV
jgi:hypothetical protein